jgi:hypothetical protein
MFGPFTLKSIAYVSRSPTLPLLLYEVILWWVSSDRRQGCVILIKRLCKWIWNVFHGSIMWICNTISGTCLTNPYQSCPYFCVIQDPSAFRFHWSYGCGVLCIQGIMCDSPLWRSCFILAIGWLKSLYWWGLFLVWLSKVPWHCKVSECQCGP